MEIAKAFPLIRIMYITGGASWSSGIIRLFNPPMALRVDGSKLGLSLSLFFFRRRDTSTLPLVTTATRNRNEGALGKTRRKTRKRPAPPQEGKAGAATKGKRRERRPKFESGMKQTDKKEGNRLSPFETY